ncbi:FumA C-terminus/TtdB family hydratase beta subunit [Desulfobotulus sp. H1]|uniref:Fumarate hydratase class I n=1 Tax=Desulfobotulus pelophilus TaxID=2823377 RepID=A0ABT3N6D9_9BACT|nr:FumA C-terminus/TtdB family hydratase beta subunit [Desulfobotulus pelophilus]MCW7753026.1 FumA C-terminus/TtdB family hydratase beta subunit [Desulfobotulus pelophilus]
MKSFVCHNVLCPADADIRWRFLGNNLVQPFSCRGRTFLELAPEGLTLLAREAFRDVSFFLRTGHLEQLAVILQDPEASANDRFVAMELLKNAAISAGGVFPMCQDTGTALVMAKKGEQVLTGADDAWWISKGIGEAYTEENLRYSQMAPLSMYEEVNTQNNLPAQIDMDAVPGEAYDFLFVAKGGGSANKTFLYNKTAQTLSPEELLPFLGKSLKEIGTSACPPYHLAVVVGGMSAEYTLKTLKLASTGYLDSLPDKGTSQGQGFRDRSLEAEVLAMSRRLGLGAQFGGKYFCHDVRVIRLPRHGASCFIGVGVSCSAHRNILGRICLDGLFLEELDRDPARFFPDPAFDPGDAVSINLNQPMDAIRAALTKLKVATRVMLNGPMVVARDLAHVRLKAMLDRGEELPAYFRDHMVYYAGPAKTPAGHASGSFGPTTAGRMDPYVPCFQEKGASLVMLAKGNRSFGVRESCRKHGGFYLGSIGGPAACLGKDCITKVEMIDCKDLGMEAVYRIEVKNFPAFVIVDDKGNDFYASFLR